jgi:glycosyltransferase involved in cell wall biosynthesis
MSVSGFPESIDLCLPRRDGGVVQWGTEYARQLEKRGVKVKIWRGEKEVLQVPFRSKAAILHTTVPIPFKRPGQKLVYSLHGNFRKEMNVWRNVTSYSMRLADAVTTPSEYLRREVGIECEVVPNAITLTGNPPGEPSGARVVGLLTNFNFPEKADGVLDLARVLAGLDSGIELLVGGDGVALEEYQQKATQIYPNIRFLGRVRKEELFAAVSVFTYYSHLDNQPLAILEAMDFGLPVLSNPVGGVPEIFAGKLVQYCMADHKQYGDALTTLLNDPSAWKAAQSAQRERASDYAWDASMDTWKRIYAEVLKPQ